MQNAVALRPKNQSLYMHIQRYLKSRARKSVNTAKKFERDLKYFFRFVRGKELDELTEEDLHITNSEAMDYQEYLSKKYKNSTVNNAFAGVRSFYTYLKRNGYDVNLEAIVVDILPDDTKVIGILNHEEVGELIQLALEEKVRPLMKSILIEVAYRTSLRASALLKLRYNDFIQDEFDPDKYWIKPEHTDKGKRFEKVLHADVVKKIFKEKEANGHSDDDLVFNISPRSLNNMMDRLTKKARIDSRREISFHSLRKAGTMSAVHLTNGNLFAVTAQGNWSNPAIVQKHYIEKQENILGMAEFDNLNEDVYDKLTREELITLLKTLDGSITEIKLKREAEKIIRNRD